MFSNSMLVHFFRFLEKKTFFFILKSCTLFLRIKHDARAVHARPVLVTMLLQLPFYNPFLGREPHVRPSPPPPGPTPVFTRVKPFRPFFLSTLPPCVRGKADSVRLVFVVKTASSVYRATFFFYFYDGINTILQSGTV